MIADNIAKLDDVAKQKLIVLIEKIVFRDWTPCKAPANPESNVKKALEKIKTVMPEVQKLYQFHDQMSAIRW